MSDFFNVVKVATADHCAAPWCGGDKGKFFRCALCGHKITEGERFIAVYTNDMQAAKGGGNPICCERCIDVCADKVRPVPELRERHAELAREFYSEKFWSFRKH
jgi:hypothetical protein